MDTEVLFLLLVTWPGNLLTMLASIRFFFGFYKLKERTYFTYLILIFSISSWSFPIMDILSLIWVRMQINAAILGAMEVVCISFSLTWIATIAIFTFMSINHIETFNPKRFLSYAIICSAIIIVIFPIPVCLQALGISFKYEDDIIFRLEYPLEHIGQQLVYFLIYDLLGRFVPLAIIIFCYIKVNKALMQLNSGSLDDSKSQSFVEVSNNRKKMVWFSVVPIICVGPTTLVNTACMFAHSLRPYQVKLLECFSFRVWGFLHLMVYWFMNEDQKEEKVETILVSNRSSVPVETRLNDGSSIYDTKR